MAAHIDFLSGSCKQDVTDLICLSAHLNLGRRLRAVEKMSKGGLQPRRKRHPVSCSLSGGTCDTCTAVLKYWGRVERERGVAR